jgi:hypothetical protein
MGYNYRRRREPWGRHRRVELAATVLVVVVVVTVLVLFLFVYHDVPLRTF